MVLLTSVSSRPSDTHFLREFYICKLYFQRLETAETFWPWKQSDSLALKLYRELSFQLSSWGHPVTMPSPQVIVHILFASDWMCAWKFQFQIVQCFLCRNLSLTLEVGLFSEWELMQSVGSLAHICNSVTVEHRAVAFLCIRDNVF